MKLAEFINIDKMCHMTYIICQRGDNYVKAINRFTDKD